MSGRCSTNGIAAVLQGQNLMVARYQPRHICILEHPAALGTWFLIDSRSGIPMCDESRIRHFVRAELGSFLESVDQSGQTG